MGQPHERAVLDASSGTSMNLLSFVVLAALGQTPAPSATPKPPVTLAPYETLLGKFGSRIAVDFQPQFRRVAFSPMGRFDDRALETTIGVRYGGALRVLPLTKRRDVFESIEQRITPTRVSYTCTSSRFPFGVRITWTAPFCPRDEKLTTAPFLYLDVEIDNPSRRAYDAEVVVSLPIDDKDEPQPWPAFRGVSLERVDAGRRTFQGLAVLDRDDADVRVDGAELTIPIHAGRFATGARRFALVGWVGDPVLDVRGVPNRFLYTKLFDGPDAVAAWARDERKTILERSALFDSTVTETGAPEALRNLVSFAFQSLAPNGWLCVDDAGREWFSTWDGFRRLHSSVDVETGEAAFYLQYWPDLLGRLLDEWSAFARPGGFLAHDMGGGVDPEASHRVGSPGYDHEMEVEESANYLILLGAYWHATGDVERVRRLVPFAATLGSYLVESDQDGDGFPDRGTGNALDDASEAVQFGSGQTYLATKTLAALRSLRDVLPLAPDAAIERRALAVETRIARTLAEDAWLGDHFAVCLERERGRTRNASTGRLLPSGELHGWNAVSIHAASGVLFPMRSGIDLPIDRGRLRTDVATGLSRTMRAFGCAHSDADDGGWISQNLWRDALAGYVGVDLAENADRYWKFELERNREGTTSDWGGFCDSPTNRSLCYDPRGAAAFAVLPALAGLSIDVPGGVLRHAPVRPGIAVPLAAFADWEHGVIPWLRTRRVDGCESFVVSLTHRDRLGAMRVIDGSGEREDGVRLELVSGLRVCRGRRSIDCAEPRPDGGVEVRVTSADPAPFFLSIVPLAAPRYDVYVDGNRWNDFTREDLARGVRVPGARATLLPVATLAAADALAARVDGLPDADAVRAAVDDLWETDRRERPVAYDVVPQGTPPVIAAREGSVDLSDQRLERAIADALSRSHGARALAPVDFRFDAAPSADGSVAARLRVRNDLLAHATISALVSADAGLVPQGPAVATFDLARGERREWTVRFAAGRGSILDATLVATVSIDSPHVGSFGSFEETARVGDGVVRSWLVAGPFAGVGLDAPLAPESDERPEAASVPAPLAWKEATCVDGFVDLRSLVNAGDGSVSFAHVWLQSPEAGPVRFGIGSDGGIRLLVDGREVYAHREARAASSDPDVVEVPLDAGWHRVLAKVEGASGRAGFQLSIRGARGLRASSSPPEKPATAGEDK
jgi:xylan 1,4-beta-xylosidase